MTTPKPTDDAVAALLLYDGRAELLEEIMSVPVIDRVSATRPDPTSRPRWVSAFAAAAVVAALIAIPVWLVNDEGKDGESQRFATEAEEADDRAILEDAVGWRVVHVDEHDGGGELDYARDRGESIEISWRSADAYEGYLEDRADVSAPDPVELFGLMSQAFHYSATDHTVIRPPDSGHFFEVRISGVSRTEFVDLLGQLRRVDEAQFGEELSRHVVTSIEELGTIARMLSDIEAPVGFDPESILVPGEFNQRYTVGVRVTEAVTCAWLDRYEAGLQSGDDAQVQRAVDAMAGSRGWAVLREMERTGDWPAVIYETADAMAAGDPAAEIRERSVCQ